MIAHPIWSKQPIELSPNNESRLLFVAQLAIQNHTDAFATTILGQHPRPLDHRWFVAYVLLVTTLQQGDPITKLILRECDGLRFHFVPLSLTWLLPIVCWRFQ